jgi:hypothetical protein
MPVKLQQFGGVVLIDRFGWASARGAGEHGKGDDGFELSVLMVFNRGRNSRCRRS